MKFYLHRLAEKFKYNSPVRLVFDALRRIGLAFIPYYLMRETAAGTARHGAVETEVGAEEEAEAESITFKRLSRDDVRDLPRAELAYLKDEWLDKRLGQGDFCLALLQSLGEMHKPRIAAICWATRKEAILVFESIALRENEAYIYAAHTFSEHRGQGLMPILRSELCRQLDAEGAKDMYSLVDSLNRPACKVYEKMSASKVQSGVAFSLFGLLNSRISFRNYESGFAER